MADSDTKTLTVLVTYKQHEWVDTLAQDLRGSMSEVVQNLIQKEIDAQESGDSYAYVLRKVFWVMVRNVDKDRLQKARALLVELNLMMDIAEKEEEARDLRRKLLGKHEDYHAEFGGSPHSMLEGK